MPRVSAIMSVFNGAGHLKESIESILAQTCRDFELLIIDDGSEDNTLEIMHDYAVKDERIKIIRNQENIGLTKSLNRAMKQATATYIARHDADDVAAPNRFEEQLDALENKPEYDVVGTNCYFVDTNGEVIDKGFRSHYMDDTKKALARGKNPLCHSSVMFRKSVVEAVGGYDETLRYAQDYELWLRLVANNHRLHNIPERLQGVRRYGREAALTTAAPVVHVKQRTHRLKCGIRARMKYLRRYWYNPGYLGWLIVDILRLLLPRSTRTFAK